MGRSSQRTQAARTVPVAIGVGAALLLAGCGAAQPATAPSPSETEELPVAEASAVVLEEFDFGNAVWSFVPYTESYPPVSVSFVDGSAEIEGIQYSVIADEVVFSDADGDGDLDAIVPAEAYGGGNAIDRQWYLWAEHGEEAVQVEMPVARTIHCGTVTTDVRAVDGGFEIHEFRRAIGEDFLACTEPGSDERTRTVGISDQGPNDALWPVQLAPFPAYGGICPASIEYDAYPLAVEVRAAPNIAADPIAADGLYEWQLGEWTIYSATFPDWMLIGVKTAEAMGCAWVQR